MKKIDLQVNGFTLLVTELGPDTYRVNYHFSVEFDAKGKPRVIGANENPNHRYTTEDIINALVAYKSKNV